MKTQITMKNSQKDQIFFPTFSSCWASAGIPIVCACVQEREREREPFLRLVEVGRSRGKYEVGARDSAPTVEFSDASTWTQCQIAFFFFFFNLSILNYKKNMRKKKKSHYTTTVGRTSLSYVLHFLCSKNDTAATQINGIGRPPSLFFTL